MSTKFNELVTEALGVERELRALSADKPSIRGWVSACLSRGGLVYTDVESVKERLGGDFLHTKMIDSGAYCRDLRRYVVGGSVKEPPRADRIERMYFSQRDGAIAELGGEARMLFALVAIVAEQVYQEERPELFGGIDDIDAHHKRIAELETKRKELHERIARGWDTSDIVLGPITSDYAALVTWKLAAEVPVGKDGIAERLIDALLAREAATVEAKAA